jgi:hypothetical protein
MVGYPKEFPFDAAEIVFAVATDGIQPEGQHGDLACLLQAQWNLQGFGLQVWKPHDHDTKGAKSAKPGKAKTFKSPGNATSGAKELARLLEPIREKNDDGTPGPKGSEEAKAAGFDWSKLPWEQIIAISVAIVRKILEGRQG